MDNSNSLKLKDYLFSNRQLAALILPIVIERLLDVSVGFADTLMVATVGEAAVSAISLVDSINNLFLFLFSALATGGAVVVAQYIGQKNYEDGSESAKQLIYTTLGISLIFGLVFILLNKKILYLLYGNIEHSIMAQSQTYFALTALSYPLLGLFNSGAALFRAMGNSRLSMRVAFIMTLLNIVGNAILIYGAKLGVFGAGLATLVARLVGALIMVLFLVKNKKVLVITNIFRVKLNFPIIKKILNIGVPNAVESGMFHIGKILVQSLTATLGTAALAANAIVNAIASATNIPGVSIGMATITVIGQSMGAREPTQAVYYAHKLMKIAYVTMAVLAALLFVFAAPLVSLFNLSNDASQLAVSVLQILLVASAILWPVSFTLPNVLRASGDVKFTMIVSITSMWLFRVGLSYILVRFLNLGLHGIWLAMYIDWLFRSGNFLVRFSKGDWKNRVIV
ncbi:MAG: MATE family efflux transporter [Sphaerochaetaceae bacterium]